MHYVRMYIMLAFIIKVVVTVAIHEHTYVTVTIQAYITIFVRFNFYPGYIYAWVSIEL